MFLLKHLEKNVQKSSSAPLHSTMFLLKPVPVPIVVLVSITFTFHNVSIKTSYHLPDPRILLYFTFHNVSIKTSSTTAWMRSMPSLHSTMFLLKPSRQQHPAEPFLPLHSTMFLLKPLFHHSFPSSVCPFTFHNVSIKTDGDRDGTSSLLASLHSTMFLLKRFSFNLWHVHLDPLHSTMFLLKPLS